MSDSLSSRGSPVPGSGGGVPPRKLGLDAGANLAEPAPKALYRRSADWPVAIGLFCLGLYTIFAKHYFLLGTGDLIVSAACTVDNILVKTEPARWRANVIRLLIAALFLASLITLLTSKK